MEITKNYRIVIRPTAENSFVAEAKHGKQKPGPRKFSKCLSCTEDDATIFENNYPKGDSSLLSSELLELRTSHCNISNLVLTESESILMNAWIDCQARPMLVVTPIRHIGDMSELSDDELASLWSAVGSCIWFCFKSNRSNVPSFEEVVLSAGNYRNIHHLHVKVWFTGLDFLQRTQEWPENMRSVWSKMHEVRRLMKLPIYDDLIASFSNEPMLLPVRVVGFFVDRDKEEIMRKFSEYGAVVSVSLGVVTKSHSYSHSEEIIYEDAFVTMTSKENLCQAIVGLNLTKIGSINVMCKTKLCV